jgi:hypothetical protein
MALVGGIFVANSPWTRVTPAATDLAPTTGPDTATLVALTSENARPVYPYSIIRGGANSADELARAIEGDPVVAAHYSDFDLAKTKVVRLEQPKVAHVSYRIGNSVYWTRKPVVIPAGETVLTDGKHMSRTRCGNCLEEVDAAGVVPGPVSPNEPAAAVLDTPIVSPAFPMRATTPFVSGPSTIAGPSASASGPAGFAGAGSGSGGFGGGVPGSAKAASSASPLAAGSLGALGLQADHALVALEGPGGPPANLFDPSGTHTPPGTQGSIPDVSRPAGGSPEWPGQPPTTLPGTPNTVVSQPAGGSPEWPGQPPTTLPGTPNTVVPTAGKDPASEPAHSTDGTPPPPQNQNQAPATIPEPGTTLLLGVAAAYAARRFMKGPAPRA